MEPATTSEESVKLLNTVSSLLTHMSSTQVIIAFLIPSSIVFAFFVYRKAKGATAKNTNSGS